MAIAVDVPVVDTRMRNSQRNQSRGADHWLKSGQHTRKFGLAKRLKLKTGGMYCNGNRYSIGTALCLAAGRDHGPTIWRKFGDSQFSISAHGQIAAKGRRIVFGAPVGDWPFTPPSLTRLFVLPPTLLGCGNATHDEVATPVWATPTAVTVTRPRHTLPLLERGSVWTFPRQGKGTRSRREDCKTLGAPPEQKTGLLTVTSGVLVSCGVERIPI